MASVISLGVEASAKNPLIDVEAISSEAGSEGSASLRAERILVCKLLASTNARYASVVIWNPFGTGNSALIIFASDMPLPPTVSSVACESERGRTKDFILTPCYQIPEIRR